MAVTIYYNIYSCLFNILYINIVRGTYNIYVLILHILISDASLRLAIYR